MLRKGLQRLTAYTVHMSVGVDKIQPFLGAVTAGRAVKEVIGTGIGLIQKGNEVVFRSSFQVHIKTKLPIQCFELVACFIHTSIPQSALAPSDPFPPTGSGWFAFP